MEKILSIIQKEFNVGGFYGEFDGFEIKTDQQVIKIGISSTSRCCEEFGCITTNDDINEFIGADLIGVSTTDLALNNKEIFELQSLQCGGAMFVNLETSEGILQFVAYNSHNGEYGHDAVLISKQQEIKEEL